MPFARRFALASSVALLCAVSSLGCKKKPSAVVLALSSEPLIPGEIDHLQIEVDRGASTPFFETYDLTDPSTKLPGTLTFQSDPAGDDESTPMTISITASGTAMVLDPGTGKVEPTPTTRVLRTATLGFTKEETKLLRLPLRYSCLDQHVTQSGDVDDTCPSGSTCIGGSCASDAIDVDSLPELTSIDEVYPAASSGECFAATCASGLASVQLATVSADCTIATGATNGKLNVFAHWVRATDGTAENDPTRLVPLDEDANEGWQFSDGASSGFRLAAGICAELHAGLIDSLSFSSSCAPKTIAQPICDSQSAVTGNAGSDTGAGGSTDTGPGGAAGMNPDG